MRYDVAILGAGIGGSTLASVLAANGVSTVLIDAGTHPRFAIGESLVPETSVRLKLLGKRFGVPEIGWLGSFHTLRDHVSPACGVKRSFAFIHHQEGRLDLAPHCNELPTLTPPFGPDAHLFRQDTDQWLTIVAAKYGVHVRQRTSVERVEFKPSHVELHTAADECIEASYVVDGTGARSLLARELGLRDEEPRFRTQSRGMFTHMAGVRPFDLVGPPRREHGMPVPFCQSTLHHVFDGGWMWVIPFDNHRASTNALTSVGIVLDRRNPASGRSPEEELHALGERFPHIREQFDGAVALRPWVAAEQLQYSSSSIHGDRFCLLPHAAGFIDPLYSSGMSITVAAIDLLAGRLIDAVRTKDFSTERFNAVETFVQNALDHYDVIVSKSFQSWIDDETWNAWNRVWAVGNYLGTWGPLSLLARYEQTKDPALLDALDTPAYRALLAGQHSEFRTIRDEGAKDITDAFEGRQSPHDAATNIFARLDAIDFAPRYMGFGRPEARAPTVFTMQTGARHILWYRWFGPERWRRYCEIGLLTYTRLVVVFIIGQLTTSLGRVRRAIRDVFFTWNSDFGRAPNPVDHAPEKDTHEHRTRYHSHTPAEAHRRSQ